MITRLTLTNFRNHRTFRIDAGNKNVALAGANGAGKTNALEAVSLLAGGAGLRRARSADMASFGTETYAAAAVLSDGMEISVYWQSGFTHRRAKANGENSPLSELSKLLGIVWLTPAEDLLFVSSPSDRRAFLDNLAAGFDPAHAGRAARLSKLLSERAFALKNNRDGGWLDLIEKNIASSAAAVADGRVRYAAELNHFFSDGEIALSGMLESRAIGGEKPGDFECFYRNYLSENRFLAADKMTIDGAHRTDFSVKNLRLGLPADKTSSGQQKLLLDKMVIANAKLLKTKSPGRPLVILMDEADGHLDESARAELFSELGKVGAQIWITGTDPDKLGPLPNGKIIVIDNGQLTMDN